MCMMSVVIGAGQQINPSKWTPDAWHDYTRIIDQAEQMDKVLDEPDCVDPEKEKWAAGMDDKFGVPTPVDKEIAAMQALADAFDGLTDGAIDRVLSWATERFN